jgi:hypothetical protein
VPDRRRVDLGARDRFLDRDRAELVAGTSFSAMP